VKALCDRKSLLAAFGQISGVAPTRSPKPVIQQCKLECSPDHGSTLIATDLEVGIRRRVLGVEVDDAGSVLLPPKVQQILAASAETHVLIETDGTTLRIVAGKSKFTLPAEDPALFPDVPKFASDAFFVLGPRDARDAIRRTMFSTDVESTRYALGGVKVEIEGEALAFIGTDGRRLAKMLASAVMPTPAPYSIGEPVIPVKALKLIDRNIDGDLTVHLAFGSNAAFVRTEDAEIYTRLVEGRFPRYQDVFPATAEVKVPMEVGQLLRATEQAAILTSDESRGVDFEFGGGALNLKTNAADVGSASVTLPIAYEGKPVGITFDPRYLTDALKVLDPASRVTAELIDGKSAAVFKTDDGYQYVIMPLTRDR